MPAILSLCTDSTFTCTIIVYPKLAFAQGVIRLQSSSSSFMHDAVFALEGQSGMLSTRVDSSFSHLASLPKSAYYREGQTSSPCPLTTGTFDSVSDSLTSE